MVLEKDTEDQVFYIPTAGFPAPDPEQRNPERNVYSPGSIKINPDNITPFYTGDNLWQNSRNPIATITITGCR
jgi:hypothetical protein